MTEKRPPTLEEFRRAHEDDVQFAARMAAEQVLIKGLPARNPHVRPKPRVPKESTPLLPGFAIQSYSRRKT